MNPTTFPATIKPIQDLIEWCEDRSPGEYQAYRSDRPHEDLKGLCYARLHWAVSRYTKEWSE